MPENLMGRQFIAMKHQPKIYSNLFSTPFNNRSWRGLLSNICHEMNKLYEIEAISPFGFELLQDKGFLNKKIRRYYCYLGIKKNNPALFPTIAALFRKKLFETLAMHNKKILDQFVLIIEQDNFIRLKEEGYLCHPQDKSIDIQCRYVTHNILDDYANYIICSLDALLNKKSDCANFSHNKRHRNRIYQLYLMLESLFNHLVPPFSDNEKIIYLEIPSMVNNQIDIFFNEHILSEPATDKENSIYLDLISPRISIIRKIIKSEKPNDNIDIQCQAYHVNDNLKVTISKVNYIAAKNKIISTYSQLV